MNLEDKIDELVRDVIKVGSMPKSEVRERVNEIIESSVDQTLDLVREWAEERLNFIEEPVKSREQMGDPLRQLQQLRTPEYLGRVDELKSLLNYLNSLKK